ncbi:MAG: mRNA-degrading endonuclease [Alphaproteobacteria bacterium 41-28]|nr:MAG: mRNA-degrading endonuclease [Alphaproteobacteria bacterium 41-28]
MVKSNPYVPQQGDIVWIELDPSLGSEMKKTRAAVVLSPIDYNKKVGLALICPITSYQKGYPFEVELSSKAKIKGVILADQVKSLDWRARKAKFEEKVPQNVILEVVEKISALLEIPS